MSEETHSLIPGGDLPQAIVPIDLVDADALDGSAAPALRFPQGVRRPLRRLDGRWRRAWYFGARAALLELPGLLVFVIPKRASVTGKRYWYAAFVPQRGFGPAAVFAAVQRGGLRRLLRDELAARGWDAVL